MGRFQTLCELILEGYKEEIPLHLEAIISEGVLEEKSSENLSVELLDLHSPTYRSKKIPQMQKLIDELMEVEFPLMDDEWASKHKQEYTLHSIQVSMAIFSGDRYYLLHDGTEEDEIIGMGRITPEENPSTVKLTDYVISKDRRGKGDGRFFLEEIMAIEKKDQSTKKLILDAHKGDTSNFYKNLGFRIRKTFIPKHYKDEFVEMSKNI